jgi:hypothetical protein
MGSDFRAAALAIEDKVNPDWEAAEAFVQLIEDTALEQLQEDYSDLDVFNVQESCLEEVREGLFDIVHAVREGYDGKDRRFTFLYLDKPKLGLIVAGGITWGDDPEGVKILTVFEKSGAAKAAGFLVED